jgi:hypothetical protein
MFIETNASEIIFMTIFKTMRKRPLPTVQKLIAGYFFLIIIFASACKSIHEIERLPDDTYWISADGYKKLNQAKTLPANYKRIKALAEQHDTVLKITPDTELLKPSQINLKDIEKINLYRYTFDIDVLTVPFKVRPSVGGFPEQLNANFDAAIYIGRRRDSYTIQQKGKGRTAKTAITGVGYGYGGFVGIGSVTMNPFVTNQHINYEYDGFVLNGGLAGIYDAKRFNLGLAIGADFLVDKNRGSWIYQGKPWFGVLFGINLN